MVAFDLVLLVMVARLDAVLSLFERIVLGCAFLIPVIQMVLAQNHFQAAPILILASLAIIVVRLPRSDSGAA
jgi:uncharacterized membrane protein